MSQKILSMTFDPNTIEDLGARMYSTLPPILAELISNAYDADAKNVSIKLYDENEKKIIIKDDGMGMTFDEINDHFLRIGRKRRSEEKQTTPGGRKVMGRKGLGKLAFFGIAGRATITAQKDGKKNKFEMDWDLIRSETSTYYTPRILEEDAQCSKNDYTEIVLDKIQRKSDFNCEQLAQSIAQRFLLDEDFKITISLNDGQPITITRELGFMGIIEEFSQQIPQDMGGFKHDYKNKSQVKGKLVVTKGSPAPRQLKGIALFARGKMVDRFVAPGSNLFNSYLTGWLEVDFIDDMEEDVIKTDRSALLWDHDELQELHEYLKAMVNHLEKIWRKKRKEEKEKKIKKEIGINPSDWEKTLPQEKRGVLTEFINYCYDAVVDNSTIHKFVELAHKMMPEYAELHWRRLHSELQNSSKNYYENGDYFVALSEAWKRYEKILKKRVKNTRVPKDAHGNELLDQSFSKKGELSVTLGYTESSDLEENDEVVENVTMGHHQLAKGMCTAFRNPLAHEEIEGLIKSGLITEKDCLDGLSLMNHLFHRLEKAEKRKSKPPSEHLN